MSDVKNGNTACDGDSVRRSRPEICRDRRATAGLTLRFVRWQGRREGERLKSFQCHSPLLHSRAEIHSASSSQRLRRRWNLSPQRESSKWRNSGGKHLRAKYGRGAAEHRKFLVCGLSNWRTTRPKAGLKENSGSVPVAGDAGLPEKSTRAHATFSTEESVCECGSRYVSQGRLDARGRKQARRETFADAFKEKKLQRVSADLIVPCKNASVESGDIKGRHAQLRRRRASESRSVSKSSHGISRNTHSDYSGYLDRERVTRRAEHERVLYSDFTQVQPAADKYCSELVWKWRGRGLWNFNTMA